MGLTPWRVVGAVLAATLLVAIAVLDIAAPPQLASCSSAEESVKAGLTSQAEHAYAKILSKEPTSHCARDGMAKVGRAWCERGKQLMEGGATLEAVTVYTTALEEQPRSQRPPNCALDGLRAANSAAAVAACPYALKAACNVTVVNVNGVNGENGRNGSNGANGRPGTNGKNGANGQPGPNGKNGVNGKSGANGRNGANGKSGANGHNGFNGRNGADRRVYLPPCTGTDCS
jgi:hypothetical protein